MRCVSFTGILYGPIIFYRHDIDHDDRWRVCRAILDQNVYILLLLKHSIGYELETPRRRSFDIIFLRRMTPAACDFTGRASVMLCVDSRHIFKIDTKHNDLCRFLAFTCARLWLRYNELKGLYCYASHNICAFDQKST